MTDMTAAPTYAAGELAPRRSRPAAPQRVRPAGLAVHLAGHHPRGDGLHASACRSFVFGDPVPRAARGRCSQPRGARRRRAAHAERHLGPSARSSGHGSDRCSGVAGCRPTCRAGRAGRCATSRAMVTSPGLWRLVAYCACGCPLAIFSFAAAWWSCGAGPGCADDGARLHCASTRTTGPTSGSFAVTDQVERRAGLRRRPGAAAALRAAGGARHHGRRGRGGPVAARPQLDGGAARAGRRAGDAAGAGWSTRPRTSAGGSSATCTTAPSSGWSRWRWTWVGPRPDACATAIRSRRPTGADRRGARARPSRPSPSCATWPAACTRRCSPTAAWTRRCPALAARSPVAGAASRSTCPSRPPPAVEAIAYFVVAEALTNVAKHAQATRGLRSSSSRSTAHAAGRRSPTTASAARTEPRLRPDRPAPTGSPRSTAG